MAAVCYRRKNSHAEFLLVNTNGGGKWTFPKGSPEARLSHSQAAEREAQEEAGAIGIIEPRHFHIYLHSKGVFWQPGGVQEYVVKAFLMFHESRDLIIVDYIAVARDENMAFLLVQKLKGQLHGRARALGDVPVVFEVEEPGQQEDPDCPSD